MPQDPPTFKPIYTFQNITMAYFYSQIEQQRRLLQCVQAVLPESLAKQARHCLIRDKKLLIYTDAAVWATQLRFYNGIMLAAIESLTRSPIKRVQIKVIVGQTGPASGTPSKANIPSVEVIENLRNHGLAVADEQLSQALLKLSSTLAKLAIKP